MHEGSRHPESLRQFKLSSCYGRKVLSQGENDQAISCGSWMTWSMQSLTVGKRRELYQYVHQLTFLQPNSLVMEPAIFSCINIAKGRVNC